MYGVPDLPLSGSTRDESTEVEHTMYNVFNKTICVCYYTNSSSGLLFIMCGYCYYIDPAAVSTCMQTNFTVHGQPPQFLIASAANGWKRLCFVDPQVLSWQWTNSGVQCVIYRYHRYKAARILLGIVV